MRPSSSVTYFKRKTSGNDIFWEKFYIPYALVTARLSANSNISVKGFVPNSEITVRFRPGQCFEPMPGDRLCIGGTDGDVPPSSCLTVLSVSGGERGARSIRYKKVVCG